MIQVYDVKIWHKRLFKDDYLNNNIQLSISNGILHKRISCYSFNLLLK